MVPGISHVEGKNSCSLLLACTQEGTHHQGDHQHQEIIIPSHRNHNPNYRDYQVNQYSVQNPLKMNLVSVLVCSFLQFENLLLGFVLFGGGISSTAHCLLLALLSRTTPDGIQGTPRVPGIETGWTGHLQGECPTNYIISLGPKTERTFSMNGIKDPEVSCTGKEMNENHHSPLWQMKKLAPERRET